MTLPKKIKKAVSSSRLENLYKCIKILKKPAYNNYHRSFRVRLIMDEIDYEIKEYKQKIADVMRSLTDDTLYSEVDGLKDRIDYYRMVIKDLEVQKQSLNDLLSL